MIEVMVATGILGIMLLSSIALIVQVNELIVVNQRTTTATYLLQECQELVRGVRDTAWKQNLQWNCAFEPHSPSTFSRRFFVIDNDPIAGGTRPACMDGATIPQMVGGQRTQMAYYTAAPVSGAPSEAPFLLDDVKGQDSAGNTIDIPYYRAVRFDYQYTGVPGAGCNNATGTAPEECNGVEVNCAVWWYGNRNVRDEVTMSQRLTNWNQ